MKYELEPENRNCSDEILLNDLQIVARQLRKSSLSKDDYNEHGRFCAATMQKRFGSWNKALELSGLGALKRVNIPHNELVADLQRIAVELKLETLSSLEYETRGKFSVPTIQKAFGSWADALRAANLKPTSWKPRATDEELFDNMAVVWERVGSQPKQNDFHLPDSRFSASTYVRRYGSWRKSLEAFVAAVNNGETLEQKVEDKIQEKTSIQIHRRTHRTSRNPGWRLRFLVNRRDEFKCRFCGKSPATHFGTVLVLDHIVAWDSGGETVMENLQTLCEPCNGGKSNLPM
jgi:hypothetical protein